jgi:trans-aconitate methyltransferase
MNPIIWLFNLGHKYVDSDYEIWEATTKYPAKFLKKILIRNTLSLIEDSPSISILSLGCGSSPILGHLKCRKVGVDISLGKLLALKSKFPEIATYCKDITTMDPIGTFDLVLLNEVIEHVGYSYTDRVLKLVSDSLNSTGKAIISMPDMDNRLGSLIENTVHKDIHISMLSGRDLIARCEKVGLVYVKRKNWSWDTAFLFMKE